jgi:surface protein
MKIKTLFGAGLVLTSVLASCSSEDLLQGSQNAGSNTLTAYIESQNDSRVSISDEGKFAWSTDDKISVASTSNSFETWSLSKINDDGSADFTSPSTVSDGAYAVFPETLNPTVSSNSLQITLPAEYESNKTVPVLMGKYNDGKVDFAHAGGLIRVSFDNVPSYANKFVFSTNNQNIAGNFTIDDNQAINTSVGTNSTITINIAGDDIKDGKITFDVPIPVGTYEGFSVGLYYGNIELASQSTTKSNTIERRDLLVMPTITATDYFAGSNYIVEKVKPTSTEIGTPMMDTQVGSKKFDISQVKSIYVDGKLQDEVINRYTFEDTSVHTIVIVLDDVVSSTTYMFYGCQNITSLDLSNFDASYDCDMSYMFYYCSRLENIDFSKIDTHLVNNMSWMFYYCLSLTSLDLSEFDVSDVTDMAHMFYGCSNLISLNVSNFNTRIVMHMSNMFCGCSSLSSLDVSSFSTGIVRDMDCMFGGCSSLTSIDVSNFDMSNVTTIKAIFSGCSSLNVIKMGCDISNITTYSNMFTNVPASGTFYYPSDYKSDYESKIFSQSELDGWTKIAQ